MRLEGLIGQHLGRYKIEALIGRGGMAAVYQAVDPALQRNVALKVLYPQYLADSSLVERFRREAITAASLDHPYIVPIYDVGEADGLVYLAMKLLPGPSLADLLQREGRLPLQRIAVLTSEIASALDEAHAHGIVHRDIKPGNVLFDARGRAMLTDFGIAKSLESSSLTESSVIVGTPDYIAPEQIDPALAPAGGIDGRADIYALGAMVYRALTGRRPFDGTSQHVLLAHLQQTPVPPSTLAPGLPPAVDAIVGRAMAKLPGDRYATATEFAQDFAHATGESTEIGIVVPPGARRPDINTRTTTQVMPAPARAARKRSPLYVVLGALVAAMLVAGFAYGMNGVIGRGASLPTRGEVEAAETTPNVATTVATPSATARASTTSAPSATIIASALAATTETTTETTSTETATPTAEPTAPVRSPAIVQQPAPARPTATARVAPTTTQRTPTRAPQRTAGTPTSVSVTPTPEVTAAPATETPEPTATETSAPPPPTDTPEPTPTTPPLPPTIQPELPPTDTPAAAGCAAPLEGGFGALWRSNPRLQESLGCPTQAEISGAAAEQVFEGGTMYWWGNTLQIYVLMNERGWGQFSDTYSEGEDLGTLSPPAGLYAPERGFGKVWRTTPAIEDALGWGTTPEISMTGVFQRFEHGVMLYTQNINGHGRQIYVLFGNGSFGIYPDPATSG